jgi:hypothetical protein
MRIEKCNLYKETCLEAGGTPINKLYGPLGLDASNSSLDILGYNVTAVQQTASHCRNVRTSTIGHNYCHTVFALLRVAFYLITCEHGEGD